MANCIICGDSNVELFLDLGETTLANKFLTEAELGEAEPTYPLRVGFCHGCGHVQLMEIVSPPTMFDDYLYMSSMSATLVGHLTGLSHAVVKRAGIGPDSLVVDVGCNDGTLLGAFKDQGVRTLGVDPAANLAEFSRAKGLDVHVGYFGAETAQTLKAAYGPASVITSTNTFPHIPALRQFVEGLDTMLDDDGIFVLEAHYLRDLLDCGAFDTIYHEHCSYWALGPLVRLFQDAGLEVFDVERLPIHHGQLRVWVQRPGRRRVAASVGTLLSEERAAGMGKFATFKAFADRAQALKAELNGALDKLKSRGMTVAGYGAPAKGNTLMTFIGLGPEQLTFIADRSPLKQGRYTPGTHIPVDGPERLLAEQPDYVLLLAWNFAEEIMEQQAEYRRRGGKFITPVPQVQIF